MKRRLICIILTMVLLLCVVNADAIRWVDFSVPYESLKYAMETDIETSEEEKHINWIDVLSLAACRTGGKCGLSSVRKAASQLRGNQTAEELLGDLYKYYGYYYDSFEATLGGLLGSYSIEVNGELISQYGLKAFHPIASGYGYTHCSDFGNVRTFGFSRKHLGHDMMGTSGTPIVAVEGGVVEALGWNRYGGWRVGVRSFDSKRYYYYAHLQKDTPFAKDLNLGDIVQAGDLLGFMGRTGYSDNENTNNIEITHLHFGLQLIFEESQKECNSEIWIDVYDIVKLLENHRVTLVKTENGWQRKYPFVDLDADRM